MTGLRTVSYGWWYTDLVVGYGTERHYYGSLLHKVSILRRNKVTILAHIILNWTKSRKVTKLKFLLSDLILIMGKKKERLWRFSLGHSYFRGRKQCISTSSLPYNLAWLPHFLNGFLTGSKLCCLLNEFHNFCYKYRLTWLINFWHYLTLGEISSQSNKHGSGTPKTFWFYDTNIWLALSPPLNPSPKAKPPIIKFPRYSI